MKQKDIAIIAVVIIISGMLSFFVSRALFNSPKNRKVKAEHVAAITTTFTPLDPNYFNPNAIDPTQLVIIGTSSNTSPFTAQ